MSKNNILLSICIPTYNRKKYLVDLLPSLIYECNKADNNKNIIEIIVSDNASTDETQLYLNTIKDARFHVYRNSTNIGPNANYIRLANYAKGKYMWLFGDDEIILPNKLGRVIKELALEKYSLLILYSFKSLLLDKFHGEYCNMESLFHSCFNFE